jgi:uncharacterized membrane protein
MLPKVNEDMNRILALLFPIIIIGFLVVSVATDQIPSQQGFDMKTFVVHAATQLVLLLGFIWYCGFAALHSTQYLTSPQDRSAWIVAIIGLNLFGACAYYLTIYQSFRKEGKGRLMSFRGKK